MGETKWYLGPSPEDVIWWRFSDYLQNTSINSKIKPIAGRDFQDLDDSTSKILSLMKPPWYEKFETKGVVIGYVHILNIANHISKPI